MKKPLILNVEKDFSIPWYEQIQKTVLMPGDSEYKTFYTIRPSDYVAVLACTPDNKIIIVRQFRPAIEDYTYELPSGHIEKGETPEQAVVRELKEETNCIAKNVIMLGEIYPDTGRLENRQWPFYSNDVEVNKFPAPDENEGIEVYSVTAEKLFEMINEGKFNHAMDLCVIAKAISKRHFKV